MDELAKDGLLVRLESCNKWNEYCQAELDNTSDFPRNEPSRSICGKLMTKTGFKAIFYNRDFTKPPIKSEYYCSKHARKLFPHYFK